MKKLLALFFAVMMVLSMAACSGPSADGKYVIGVCQIQKHPALDAATQGFQDALIQTLGADKVEFKVRDAAGDPTTCDTIMDTFVADNVNLILANATPPLQSARNKTATIPVLGTSVTDYVTALNIKDFNGTVGGNISGTTDLAPLNEQAQMIIDLFPNAKKVGLLYCSAEPNSVYQITEVKKYLEAKNITCTTFAFNDANDLTSVTESACSSSDVIYIPTDNTAATYAETIGNVVKAQKKPVVAGEAGICKGCGVATLSIDYYDLGYITGQMAAKILKGEANISTMPIQSAPKFTKMYNKEIAQELKVTIPSDYQEIS
jgi:putative ABC transport system substrate-binding protein